MTFGDDCVGMVCSVLMMGMTSGENIIALDGGTTGLVNGGEIKPDLGGMKSKVEVVGGCG